MTAVPDAHRDWTGTTKLPKRRGVNHPRDPQQRPAIAPNAAKVFAAVPGPR
jgi:hypothetical protein